MKRIGFGLVLLALAGFAVACAKEAQKDAGGAPPSSAGAPSGSGSSVGSPLDQGPRAFASPVDESLAEKGEELFKAKGCSACHTFGQKLTGPDLAGVSQRRTASWIENQILHPDKMTKEDPIAKDLFAKFLLQMPNQGVTADEARALIEYFKEKDQPAAKPRG